MLSRDMVEYVFTEDIALTRDYFVSHLGAKVIEDCRWYVSVRFNDYQPLVVYTKEGYLDVPRHSCVGITYDVIVEDIDQAYIRLREETSLHAYPVESHPAGGRSFNVLVPTGLKFRICSRDCSSVSQRP